MSKAARLSDRTPRVGTIASVVLALVLPPLTLSGQESQRLFPVTVASFANAAPGAISPTLPQSSGEKNPAVAVLLNALLFPGIGNFYAGNSGHGLRHVGLAIGGGAFFVAGLAQWDSRTGEGEGLMWTGVAVVAGNWIWSIFSGISDAQAAGDSGDPGSSLMSMVQPQLVPLGLHRAVGEPLGMTADRLGLQLLRFTF